MKGKVEVIKKTHAIRCKKYGCNSIVNSSVKFSHISYCERVAWNKNWKQDIYGFFYCPDCYKKYLV